GRSRTQPPLVVMREELRLVRRHVDGDRAVVLAALALQAEIECLGDRLAAPAVLDDVAAHHLEQQMRAPPRRVHLLARRLEARAHRLPARRAALADAEAA